jgi:hypothetical protein
MLSHLATVPASQQRSRAPQDRGSGSGRAVASAGGHGAAGASLTPSTVQLPAQSVTGRGQSGEPGAEGHNQFGTMRPGAQEKAQQRRGDGGPWASGVPMFTTHSGAAFGWSVAKAAQRTRCRLTKAPGIATPPRRCGNRGGPGLAQRFGFVPQWQLPGVAEPPPGFARRPIISIDTPALMAS